MDNSTVELDVLFYLMIGVALDWYMGQDGFSSSRSPLIKKVFMEASLREGGMSMFHMAQYEDMLNFFSLAFASMLIDEDGLSGVKKTYLKGLNRTNVARYLRRLYDYMVHLGM